MNLCNTKITSYVTWEIVWGTETGNKFLITCSFLWGKW